MKPASLPGNSPKVRAASPRQVGRLAARKPVAQEDESAGNETTPDGDVEATPEAADPEATETSVAEPASVDSGAEERVRVMSLRRLDLPPCVGDWRPSEKEAPSGRPMEEKTVFWAPREVAARLQDSGNFVVLES